MFLFRLAEMAEQIADSVFSSILSKIEKGKQPYFDNWKRNKIK